MGQVNGIEMVWKNNIASNFIGTDEYMNTGTSSYHGFQTWGGIIQPGPSPQPMDYSLCYNLGMPLPSGCNSWGWSSGFSNQVSAGVGCYQNYRSVDPEYDITPGDNFYHPTNVLISEGADDGSEMGAFGVQEGGWVAFSQIWD